MTEDGEEYESLVKIIKMYYALAILDGKAMSGDNFLLYQWNEFNSKMQRNMRRLFLFVDRSFILLAKCQTNVFSICLFSISGSSTLMSLTLCINRTNHLET